MVKFPSSIVCPMCKSEIHLEQDVKGFLRTDDILTMRIRTPFYVHSEKVVEASLNMSLCSHCNTIIGINKKSMWVKTKFSLSKSKISNKSF